MSDIELIPLSRLYIHSLNSRSEPPPLEIDLLAQSIQQAGLLQNLMGFKDFEAGYADANDLQSVKIGIVAGGRRLRALWQLYRDTDPDMAIPVRITADAATAAEWAGTENTARAALNPADEVRAYSTMRAKGASPNQIARAFAVREQHVLGRLRLAILPEPALDALRTGDISLDQAAALTVAEDDKHVLTLLPTIIARQNGYGRMGPDAIRNALRPQAVPVNDRRAVFVGIDLYSASGGRIQADLFSDSTVLLDPDILDDLFARRLEEVRAEIAAEGWAKVAAFAEPWPNHEVMLKAGERLRRHAVDLPPGDQAEYDALSDAAEDRELTDAELRRLDELEDRQRGDYSDEDRAAATLFIFVDRDGALRREDAFRAADAADGLEPDAGTTSKPETISDSLRQDLNAIGTLALQTALLDRPELMLDLLAMSLTRGLSYNRPLALAPSEPAIEPAKTDDGVRVSDRLAQAIPGYERTAEPTLDLLQAIQTEGKKARNAAITAALARTFQAANAAFGRELAASLGVTARSVWTPTAANFFSRMPGGMLDDIWAQLVPEGLTEPSLPFRNLKKAEKAARLHDLFNSADFREALGLSREQAARIDAWLPQQLRAPETITPAIGTKETADA